jgi:hypothetical protein
VPRFARSTTLASSARTVREVVLVSSARTACSSATPASGKRNIWCADYQAVAHLEASSPSCRGVVVVDCSCAQRLRGTGVLPVGASTFSNLERRNDSSPRRAVRAGSPTSFNRGEHESTSFANRRQPRTGGASGTRLMPFARTICADRKRTVDLQIAAARRNQIAGRSQGHGRNKAHNSTGCDRGQSVAFGHFLYMDRGMLPVHTCILRTEWLSVQSILSIFLIFSSGTRTVAIAGSFRGNRHRTLRPRGYNPFRVDGSGP